MSDNNSKSINSSETDQSATFKVSLNELHSADKRKEILNGKKSTEVHGDKFYIKIRENQSLMDSTFVLK